MSVYVVHECDWCEVRVQHLMTATTDATASARRLPEKWRDFETDPGSWFKTTLCPKCVFAREAALELARTRVVRGMTPETVSATSEQSGGTEKGDIGH